MKPPSSGKTWRRYKAGFILSKDMRKEVLEWIKMLMFLMGMQLTWVGVNLSNMRVLGMKSHDYHIWIEWILLAMGRGYVLKHVWQVLAKLSYFFCQLFAKELS
jgi:hypothetical protein